MKTAIAIALTGLALSAPAFAASDGHASVSAIALYSQGAAVVQDSRSMDLDQGGQGLTWPVPGTLQPDTLWLSGRGVRLIGFDLASQGAQKNPLAARIGRPVTLSEPDKHRKGRLVAVHGETAFVQVDDRIERVPAAGPVRLSWPADQKQSGHRVQLHIHADQSGQQKLTATYQMDAPEWQASYVGRFNSENNRLELSANAVIDNSGHGALDADRAWLVAGNTARAEHGGPRPMMMARMAASKARPAGKAQAVGDVYRYPLAHGLHVAAGSTQSVALIKPFRVKAKRHYRFENYALNDHGKTRQHVRVSLTFDNTSKAPLPAGAVRVYDAAHTAQLMGGSQIDDTPAGAPVKLALGGAFDVTGTHRVVRQSTGDHGAKKAKVAVELFNAGDHDRQVSVAEQLPSGAQLAEDAPKPSGGSANKPQWQVKVPAHGHKALSYRFTQPKSS